MRQKLARLMVVIGAFLLANQFESVSAQGNNCECTGTRGTEHFLFIPPTCEEHTFDYWTYTSDDVSCQTYCIVSSENQGPADCAADAGRCPSGNNPTHWFYSGYVFWNGSFVNLISDRNWC